MIKEATRQVLNAVGRSWWWASRVFKKNIYLYIWPPLQFTGQARGRRAEKRHIEAHGQRYGRETITGPPRPRIPDRLGVRSGFAVDHQGQINEVNERWRIALHTAASSGGRANLLGSSVAETLERSPGRQVSVVMLKRATANGNASTDMGS